MSSAPKYNELTADQRRAHYRAQLAAFDQLVSGNPRLAEACANDSRRAVREARFILSVARKCGDAWATVRP